MKLLKYILPAILVLIPASCQVAFDLDIDEKSVIFLESFPGVDDIVEFDIQPAYSLSNSAPRPEFKPEIVFTVNGEEIPVVQNKGFSVSEEYLEERYIADYKPVPGDKMRIEVSSEGFESIFAETVIPAPFPKRKIDFRKEDVGENECNILYVIPDSEKDSPYAYGMNIFMERTSYLEDSTYVSTSTYTGDQISDYYEMSPVSFDGLVVRYGYNNPRLGVWQNTHPEQCIMSYILDSYMYSGIDAYDSFFDHEGETVEYADDGTVIGTYRYRERNKLYLYTLTEEFYKYAIAQLLVYNNTDFPGIAPANFCYTNINGGTGAFAGLTRIETDWITKEFIENNR